MQVSVSDDTQSLAALVKSAREEPVRVLEDGRAVAVIVSAERYERLNSTSLEDFSSFCDRMSAYAQSCGMNEQVLAELLLDDAR